MNDIPRRSRVDLMTPAELAIRAAMIAVEAMAADTRLTDAVILLDQARNKVADYVDGKAAQPVAQASWEILAREYEATLKALCESADPIAALADWTAQAGLPPPKALPTAELREEVVFWRRDAIARLWMAIALYRGAEKKRDHQRAAELRVSHIMPALAALRDANAKAWHLDCEMCDKPLRHDEPYRVITIDEDGTTSRIHAACGDSDWPIHQPDPDDEEKIIRDAREVLGLTIMPPANDVRPGAGETPATAP